MVVDSSGAVNHGYIPQGKIVKKEYYLDAIRRLRDTVPRKPPDLRAVENWQFASDEDFLGEVQHFCILSCPYSPDMAPCYLWLFPNLKQTIKGTLFESRDDIIHSATVQLSSILKEVFRQ